MNDAISAGLWDSAFDFHRVVLPFIRGWLPPGEFVRVEDAPRTRALEVVDQVAGVDAWYVSGSTRLQGIASRVQWGTKTYESFTIRSWLPTGAPTELAKRLEALRDHGEHLVVPHFTVQAWVDRRRTGRLLMVMMIPTEELFTFVVEHPEKVEHRRNGDGTEFIVVWAEDLRAAGYAVRQGGEFDIEIGLRGGRFWSPYSVPDEQEADVPDEDEDDGLDDDGGDVFGFWSEDDHDVCAYCGVGMARSGEVCPACGTFRA
jgi:hypothetical protein